MKKISLKNPENPDSKPVRRSQNLYRVTLGEGKINLFGSMKEATAFVAETNRTLNLFLHQANSHYAELFSMYRHCWFYFLDKAKGVNRIAVEKQITVHFQLVDTALNRCIHNTTGPNGNIFAFTFLENAVDHLLTVADKLKNILQIRNELVNRYRVDVLETLLHQLLQRIRDYGKTDVKH